MKGYFRKSILFLLVILTVFSLMGCKHSDQKEETSLNEANGENETTETKNTEETTESAMDEVAILDAFVQMTENPETGMMALIAYMDQTIPFISAETVDAMLNTFESVHIMQTMELDADFMSEEKQTYLQSYAIEDLKTKNVKDADLLKLLEKVEAMGYKVEQVEGFIGPYVDYGFYLKYADYGTESCQKYFSLMKTESDLPSVFDGGLVVSWEEVLNRSVNLDEFITLYPESLYVENAKIMLQGYVEMMLIGTLNVPVYDDQTNQMNESVKVAYINFQPNNANLSVVKNLSAYLELLESSDYIKTEKVENFIEEIIASYK